MFYVIVYKQILYYIKNSIKKIIQEVYGRSQILLRSVIHDCNIEWLVAQPEFESGTPPWKGDEITTSPQGHNIKDDLFTHLLQINKSRIIGWVIPCLQFISYK